MKYVGMLDKVLAINTFFPPMQGCQTKCFLLTIPSLLSIDTSFTILPSASLLSQSLNSPSQYSFYSRDQSCTHCFRVSLATYFQVTLVEVILDPSILSLLITVLQKKKGRSAYQSLLSFYIELLLLLFVQCIVVMIPVEEIERDHLINFGLHGASPGVRRSQSLKKG